MGGQCCRCRIDPTLGDGRRGVGVGAVESSCARSDANPLASENGLSDGATTGTANAAAAVSDVSADDGAALEAELRELDRLMGSASTSTPCTAAGTDAPTSAARTSSVFHPHSPAAPSKVPLSLAPRPPASLAKVRRARSAHQDLDTPSPPASSEGRDDDPTTATSRTARRLSQRRVLSRHRRPWGSHGDIAGGLRECGPSGAVEPILEFRALGLIGSRQ